MPGQPPTPDRTGIPPGILDPLLGILRSSRIPVRRRKLLEELEHRGHRLSLAGLNRALQYCQAAGLTIESPEGVRCKPAGRAEPGTPSNP
jgi:hypothetical protein